MQLYNNLYAEIDYPEQLASNVERGAAVWKAFCELPQDTKDQFHFGGDDWNFGYIKKGSKKNEDEKEYYHYAVHHQDLLEKHGLVQIVEQNPVVRDFFSYCDQLWDDAVKFANDYSDILARNNKHIDQLPEQTAKGWLVPWGVMRFLHYTPDPDAEILADPHFDRGGMTYHLYESKKGLQFMDWDNNWIDAPVKEGATVLFSGQGLQSMSDGVIQRTWHRVVRDPDATSPERYSIVLFCDFPDVPGWDRFRDGVARLQPLEYNEKQELD